MLTLCLGVFLNTLSLVKSELILLLRTLAQLIGLENKNIESVIYLGTN